MRTQFFISFIVLAMFTVSILVSCGGNKLKKPDDLIAESKMVDILTDLTLLNAGQTVNKTEFQKHGISPDTYVYRKYNIDSVQFSTSNNYYAHNIDVYEGIFDRVRENINNKKAEFKKIEEEEKKKLKIKDSLKRIQLRKPDTLKNKLNKTQLNKLKKRPLKKDDLAPQ